MMTVLWICPDRFNNYSQVRLLHRLFVIKAHWRLLVMRIPAKFGLIISFKVI